LIRTHGLEEAKRVYFSCAPSQEEPCKQILTSVLLEALSVQ